MYALFSHTSILCRALDTPYGSRTVSVHASEYTLHNKYTNTNTKCKAKYSKTHAVSIQK